MSLTISIEPRVFSTFPHAFVVALRAEHLDTANLAPIALAELHRGAETARHAVESLATIADHPIIAAWRKAYGAMGVKPSKYRSSIEALARRVLRGDRLGILPAVDLYNGCSLAAMAPLGAADLDLVPSPEITLRHARPGEDSFMPLGGRSDEFPLTERTIVYAAGSVVLCWAMNCRDSKMTALRRETARAVFMSEGVTREHRIASEAAMSHLGSLLGEVGVVVNSTGIDAGKPGATL